MVPSHIHHGYMVPSHMHHGYMVPNRGYMALVIVAIWSLVIMVIWSLVFVPDCGMWLCFISSDDTK